MQERSDWILKVFGFLTLLWFCFGLTVVAQVHKPTPEQSIVGIKASIPNAARTARTLGIQRSGSGIVIDQEGLIVTIGYIILEAESVQVIDINGEVKPASVVGYHAETGFGLLRTALTLKAKPLVLGESKHLTIRDPVTIISHSPYLETSPAFVVSRKTFAGYWEYLLENAIYTIPAAPSYAGAALIDQTGALVGVGSLLINDEFHLEGRRIPANLFVPIDQLKPNLSDLITKGRLTDPQRPWLGLVLTERHGRVVVLTARPQTPAQEAGLQTGDIILEIDGHPIDSMETMYRTLWNLGVSGIEIPLTLLHRNTLKKINILSGNRYHHYYFSHIN